MKLRIYKQVIELGHYVPNFNAYWDDWAVDSVIDNAEKVAEYIAEAKKESTSFSRGVYYSKKYGNFAIKYRFLGEWKDEEVE